VLDVRAQKARRGTSNATAETKAETRYFVAMAYVMVARPHIHVRQIAETRHQSVAMVHVMVARTPLHVRQIVETRHQSVAMVHVMVARTPLHVRQIAETKAALRMRHNVCNS